MKGRGYSAPRRIPRTFRVVNIVIIRCEPTFRRPAIIRSNGILLFHPTSIVLPGHRGRIVFYARTRASSVLEIETEFRARAVRDAPLTTPSVLVSACSAAVLLRLRRAAR